MDLGWWGSAASQRRRAAALPCCLAACRFAAPSSQADILKVRRCLDRGAATSLVEGLVFLFFTKDLGASNFLCGLSVAVTVPSRSRPVRLFIIALCNLLAREHAPRSGARRGCHIVGVSHRPWPSLAALKVHLLGPGVWSLKD